MRIPTPLRAYTDGAKEVDVDGATVDDLLRALDERFPGIRFRVVDEQGRLRKHMKVFVGPDSVRDLSTPVAEVDEVTLMQALSGG